MSESSANPALGRLMRHMAWANQSMLAALESLPVEAFALRAAGDPEGTVGDVTAHLVRSAGFYCFRLGAAIDPVGIQSASTAAIPELKEACAAADAKLREQALVPDGVRQYTPPDGSEVMRFRSTIVAQAIHHATEHRAQIADILTEHGIRIIDLDQLDLWEFEDYEVRTNGLHADMTQE